MRSLCALLLGLTLMAGQFTLVYAGAIGEGSAQPGPHHRPQTTAIFDRMAVITVKLMDDDGAVTPVEVKAAVNTAEYQAGFQAVGAEVIEKSLILFVFPEELVTRFHMRNVEAPLDIAFIGSDGEILDIQQMQPDPSSGPGMRTYGPNRAFRYALEAHAGYFQEHRISAGKGRLLLH